MSRDLADNFSRSEAWNATLLARQENIIRGHYRDAVREIQAELARLYEKYSTDGALTYAQMTKYNRLLGLEKQIGGILGANDKAFSKTLKKLTAEQYEEAYFGHAWAIDNNVGVALKWGMIREADIVAITSNPLSLISKSPLTNTTTLSVLERSGIRRAIVQGLIQGQSYPKMATGIKDVMNKSFGNAVRIARTEGHRAQVEGIQKSFVDAEVAGVDGIQVWSATLDERTRSSHGHLDGVPAEMINGEPHWTIGGFDTTGPGKSGVAAEDINCRCVVRLEIEGLAPELRRTQAKGIEPYIKYDDWIKRYNVSGQLTRVK